MEVIKALSLLNTIKSIKIILTISISSRFKTRPASPGGAFLSKQLSKPGL